MRYQKPHDYSAKEQIFINVEPDDVAAAVPALGTYVRGNLVLWHLADESGNFTAGNLPAFNTQGLRVVQAVEAGSVRAAGFVETLPAANGVATNLAQTRPGFTFEIQVYGFHDAALADAAGCTAGTTIEAGALVHGSVTDQAGAVGGDGPRQVGFAFENIAGGARGPIFIKGLL